MKLDMLPQQLPNGVVVVKPNNNSYKSLDALDTGCASPALGGGRQPRRSLSPLPMSPMESRYSAAIGNGVGGASCNGNPKNLFSHIPLQSALLEHMNKSLFQEIVKRQADFMKSFNSGDAHGAAELYDPDGYFMPNGRTPVKGRDGIEKFFQQDMADGVQSAQVNGSGEWAFERGSYHLETSRGVESGAYILVWRNIDGVWLIHNDCFNVVQAREKA